jgi:hypothetical protein
VIWVLKARNVVLRMGDFFVFVLEVKVRSIDSVKSRCDPLGSDRERICDLRKT